MTADILIVDDEADIRALIQGILSDEGFTTRVAANAKQAFERVQERTPDLVILDIWLQHSDQDGLQILEAIKKNHKNLPVLMISGHGNIETAVAAIKKGAYDFIEKPFKSDRLILMIGRALETARLKEENANLRRRAEGPAALIGTSAQMVSVRNAIERVAQTNSRVLLTGKPGTGKDIAARLIHKMSRRAQGPFMALNCAVLRPERLEIELFGTEEGVMGEPAQRGVLEQANGGTLFLDEILDMPLETQGKIIRVLQEERFQRLGGKELVDVDVRVISSTNRDLEDAIAAGHFRQDLYYRLNVVPIEMPPLADRLQDIDELVQYFSELYAQESGIPARSFSSNALAALQTYSWPGNVRQLKNIVERLMIMVAGPEQGQTSVIDAASLPPEITALRPHEGKESLTDHAEFISAPLREAREMFEREYIQSQIRRFGGNISRTAQFVGMERSALHRKMRQLGISVVGKHDEDSEGDSSPDLTSRKSA